MSDVEIAPKNSEGEAKTQIEVIEEVQEPGPQDAPLPAVVSPEADHMEPTAPATPIVNVFNLNQDTSTKSDQEAKPASHDTIAWKDKMPTTTWPLYPPIF